MKGTSSTSFGAKDYIDHLTSMSKKCPQQKYALGGHSQGGFVTVSVIPRLPQEVLSRIVAVAMFGSPPCPAAVKDRCNSYCNAGDGVCSRSTAKAGREISEAIEDSGMSLDNDLEKMLSLSADDDDDPERFVLGEFDDLIKRQEGSECAKYAGAAISGHQAVRGGNGHLAYNGDGYYVHAAACFIAEKFAAAKR
jgi:pimeloyl-ACP methyl ester carboxylesterase